MRLWHKSMIEFLPDMQLKGQWRECALIAYELKEHGTPNHLLVNRVAEYPIDEFYTYFILVWGEMKKRGFNSSLQSAQRVSQIGGKIVSIKNIFDGWHNKEYLRICYANLFEKYKYGVGKSRITDLEWGRLCMGYKEITGEEYAI